MERHEIYYSGRVQGVGFRATTAQVARPFEVTGFVKNLGDGRVQMVVEGSPDTLDAFLAAVSDRMAHNIDKVSKTVVPPTGEFTSFDIRY